MASTAVSTSPQPANGAEDALAVYEQYRQKVSERQSPKEESVDFMQALWYKIQWSDLLVPAPTSIMIFGQLTSVAQIANTKLIIPEKNFGALMSTDFRSAVLELKMKGTTAFSNSYSNMGALGDHCLNLKKSVREVMEVVAEQGMEDLPPEDRYAIVLDRLPELIAKIKISADACATRTENSAKEFKALLTTAADLQLACQKTQADAENQEQGANALAVNLEAKLKKYDEIMVMQKDFVRQTRDSSKKAEERYDDALKSMPNGWDLVGMRAVDKLVSTASNALGQGVQMLAGKPAFMALQGMQAIGGLVDKIDDDDTAGDGSGRQPHSKTGTKQQDRELQQLQEWKDPVFEWADDISDATTNLSTMLSKGKGGAPMWDSLVETATGPMSLKSVTNILTSASQASYGQSPSARKALEIATTALTITAGIVKFVDLANRNSPDIAQLATRAEGLERDAEKLNQDIQLRLGKSGHEAPVDIEGIPEIPAGTSEDVASMAVKNAQFKVSMTQQAYLARTEAYDKATQGMITLAKEMADFSTKLAEMNFKKIQWEKVNGMLLDSINYLDRLYDSLLRLTQFFRNIADIVNIVLLDACKDLAEDGDDVVKQATDRIMSRYTYRRRVMMKHAIMCNNIQYVMGRIASLYCEMYRTQVDKGISMLMDMSSIQERDDSRRQALVMKKANDLQVWCAEASRGMGELLKKELNEFTKNMDTRTVEFAKTYKAILPPPPPALEKQVERGRIAFVNETKVQIAVYQPQASLSRRNAIDLD